MWIKQEHHVSDNAVLSHYIPTHVVVMGCTKRGGMQMRAAKLQTATLRVKGIKLMPRTWTRLPCMFSLIQQASHR